MKKDTNKQSESDYPFMISENPNALYIIKDHRVGITNGTWTESYMRYPFK